MNQTPIVLVIQSKDAVDYRLRDDGTVSLSFCFPEPFDIDTPHVVKLLRVHGPRKPIFVTCNFIRRQALNRDYKLLLGTSFPGANTYVPVQGNYIPAVGYFIISHLDGTRIRRADNITLWLHLVPQDQLPLWRQ